MKKESKKILIWSYGNFFQKKILPIMQFNNIKIEKIFSQKKNIKTDSLVTNNEKKFFKNNTSKIVYINNTQKFHYLAIKKCLKNNLNVICEKSLCMTHKETIEVFKLAQKKNLFLTCASYYIYHPAFIKIKNILKNNKSIGKPKFCISSFGFQNNFDKDTTYRAKKKLGASAILDLGFYPLSLEYFLFNEYKKKINFSILEKSKKLGFDVSGNVLISDKNFYRFYFWGYNFSYKNSIKIIFEKGIIQMNFIFSKNINKTKLKILIKNKVKNYEYTDINQEEIAFKKYLKLRKEESKKNELIALSKLIDKVNLYGKNT